jgi:hypothetical protein
MDIEDMDIEDYYKYDESIDWYEALDIEFLRENWLDARADDWTSREDD